MLRRRRVKTFEVGGSENVELAKQVTVLNMDGQIIKKLVSQREFVLAACQDERVRVYDRESTGAVRTFITEHERRIDWLEGLEDDLVVSADKGGQIITWRPFTMKAIGSWKDYEECVERVVAKLDENRMVVCSGKRDLVVLSHTCGSNLKMEKRIKTKRRGINNIVVSDKLLVSCSGDTTAEVFDKRTFQHLASLRAKYHANDVAISETHIFVVRDDGLVYVYRNAPPYALDFALQTPNSYFHLVICLNNDMIAVSDDNGSVNFISLSNKSFVARVNVSNSYLSRITVLRDNSMAVVDRNGLCMLFRPPQRVQHAVIEYTTTVYGKYQPILDAWNSVWQTSLSVVDACKTIINSENMSSLKEWLLRAAEMMKPGQESNQEGNATKVVEVEEEAASSPALYVSKVEITRLKDTLSENGHGIRERENEAEVGMRGRENRTDSRAQGETSVTKIPDAPQHAVSNTVTSEQTVNVEVARVELTKWENEALLKSSVENLKDEEAATFIAAFLENYRTLGGSGPAPYP